MSESHAHDHAHQGHQHHDHSHGEGENSYYLDQLCTVALSGAFGGICLSLYFWKTGMLNILLGPQFFKFVLISGITLVILALLRGVVLWIEAGKTAALAHAHNHSHEHGHDHDHDHAPDHHNHEHHHHDTAHDHHHDTAHEHAQGHEHCCAEHHIGHAHGHHAHHDHGPEDHDHGWAPWRYVVMLLPVLFFMLGLPNRGPQAAAQAVEVRVDPTKDLLRGASMLLVEGGALQQAGLAFEVYKPEEKATPIDFKMLNDIAGNSQTRADWDHKIVKVKSVYSPSTNNPHIFQMVKFKLECCGADAVAIRVNTYTPEPITQVIAGDWIWVTGKIEFVKKDSEFATLVRIASSKAVEKTTPEVNPYAR